MVWRYMYLSFCCFTVVGAALPHHNCLTWTINQKKLELTCKVTDFFSSVAFFDSISQEQARCDVVESSFTCHSSVEKIKVVANYSTLHIILTINDFEPSRIDGQWTCTQGKNKYFTTISTSRGIIDSTEVHLIGEVLGTTSIMLKCYSCREPRHNVVEFQINNSSADYVTYNPSSGKCFHGKEECRPHICSCSPSGNEFTRIFSLTKNVKELDFSCHMSFMDDTKSSKFSVLTTVVFNGKGFFNNGTAKTITKHPEKESDSDSGINETLSEKVTITADDDEDKSQDSTSVIVTTITTSIAGTFALGMIIFVISKFIQKKVETIIRQQRQRNYEFDIDSNTENTLLLDDRNYNELKNIDRVQSSASETRKRKSSSQSIKLSVETSHLGQRTDLKITTLPRTNKKETMRNYPEMKYCQPCSRNKEATVACYRCTDCNENLCLVCKGYHERMTISMQHSFEKCVKRVNSVPSDLVSNSSQFT